MSSSALAAPPRPSALARLVAENKLAEQFGWDRCTLFRYRKRRRNPLPFIRIGRRIFYDVDAIDRWLQRCSVNSAR